MRTDYRVEWWIVDGAYSYRVISIANGNIVSSPVQRYSRLIHMRKMIRNLFGEIEMVKVDAPKRLTRVN